MGEENTARENFRSKNSNNSIYEMAHSLLQVDPSILLRQKNIQSKAKSRLQMKQNK